MTTHNPETCEFCTTVRAMKRIMAMVEDMPEFDVPLYDDAVLDVYEAAQDAVSVLRCYSEDLSDD